MSSSSRWLTDNFGLEGRTALVTGAARGIGHAIAADMAKAGAIVHILGRDHRTTEIAAAAIGARPWACDLAVESDIDRFCAEFRSKETGLDVLVNNAGIELPARLAALDRETLEATFSVNVFAPIALTRRLLPMLERSPRAAIVNISSIHDTVPSYGNTAYASSKAALRMVTENLAVELGEKGIRVNAIAPGAIATDINATVLDRIGRSEFASWIPVGRIGDVSEIGPTVVFLASDAARYISGATLLVDGAYSHHLVRYRESNHEGE